MVNFKYLFTEMRKLMPYLIMAALTPKAPSAACKRL